MSYRRIDDYPILYFYISYDNDAYLRRAVLYPTELRAHHRMNYTINYS